MFKSDMFTTAYDDDVRALALNSNDAAAFDGLVPAAVLASRTTDALNRVTALVTAWPAAPAPRVAQSKLLAAGGSHDAAVAAAEEASHLGVDHSAALEQLASLYADAGDVARLDTTVDALRRAPRQIARPRSTTRPCPRFFTIGWQSQ